jgi:hypothetical protein
VAVGNDIGLQIESNGSTLLHTSSFTFKLNNMLHCPQALTSLPPIQKFCLDNFCYFTLTSSHYFIKDLLSHATLLEERSENGLYPLWLGGNLHKGTKTFIAFIGIRTTSLVWHFRLRHPSLEIVNRIVKEKLFLFLVMILRKQHLLFLQKQKATIACQLGKSKRQPSHASSQVSFQPIKLIRSDIWTSSVQSISGYKYHVVFIDDC